MAVTDFSAALIGTSESTLSSSISNNGTLAGSEIDVLGGTNRIGVATVYLVYTSTVTAGSIDVYLEPARVTGQSYTPRNPTYSIAPTNATAVKIPLGQITITSRYMSADVVNNATGASCTVSVLLAGQYFS